MGFERLATELVPRSRVLRDQLRPARSLSVRNRVYWGIYWDNGKENGNYYLAIGLNRDCDCSMLPKSENHMEKNVELLMDTATCRYWDRFRGSMGG